MGAHRLSVSQMPSPSYKERTPAAPKFVVLALALLAALASGARAAEDPAWLLDAAASRFYMQTAKANAIIETHRFTGLDGAIDKDGKANVRIDLMSVASGIDVRDVRMRFLLFETYKFPYAEVTAKLDMRRLQELLASTRIAYDLKFTLSLHGVSRDIETPVNVTRLSDKTVSVTSITPVILNATDFDLTAGLAKLSDAVNGTPIVSAASISFDLVFATGEQILVLDAARAATEKQKAAAETAAITPEACATRFAVISTAQAIYFQTGSAILDKASEPLLDSVVDIANRCPSVGIEVTGHTDSIGSKTANQQLSDQRAKAVAGHLAQRGIRADRITASGYGDTRPIVANDTDANRAKNRRIEFRIKAN
jgi:OOP family OmpA-OmpF porin